MPTDPSPSSEPPGIFRPEALRHHARTRGPGDVIRVAPRWTSAAFYVLIGLFAAALVASILIDIDRYAPGTTAVDDRGRLVVLLPAALAPEVPVGRPVDLGDGRAEVVASDGTVLSPGEVGELFNVDVAAPSVVVVTSAEGTEPGGVARVLIEREPIVVALIPGLDALFGDDDG